MGDGSFSDRPVVLFDFDGTVVNTGPCVIRGLVEVLRAHGMTSEEMGDLTRFIGPPLVDCFQESFGLTRAEAEAYTAEYRSVFDTFDPGAYPAFPGVPELLDGLKGSGRRLAVATSRKEDRARMMARQLGLGQFEAVMGMNEPAGRRYKVDSVRDAMRELGAAASDCVMVGDRHFDVEGAHSLGVPCIGICYSGTDPAEFAACGADGVCESVADVARALGIDPGPVRAALERPAAG